MTRYKPILFSGEMIRAILRGDKTQTRRVVKPQPMRIITDWTQDAEPGEVVVYQGWPHRLTESRGRNKAAAGELTPVRIKPRYEVGTVLWVRETHVMQCNVLDDPPPFDDGRPVKWDDDGAWLQPHYRATDPTPELAYDDSDEPGCKWRPSIFLPRWACRLFLTVTRRRIEQVQRISAEGCLAEGIGKWIGYPGGEAKSFALIKRDFRQLWDSINLKRGFGWDSNPWNFVYDFEIKEVLNAAA